jgi:hypothetical protein
MLIFSGDDTMSKKQNTAQSFNDKYVTKDDIVAAGGEWHSDGAYYKFPDGSWGRFTDIRNHAQESRLRFIGGKVVND